MSKDIKNVLAIVGICAVLAGFAFIISNPVLAPSPPLGPGVEQGPTDPMAWARCEWAIRERLHNPIWFTIKNAYWQQKTGSRDGAYYLDTVAYAPPFELVRGSWRCNYTRDRLVSVSQL